MFVHRLDARAIARLVVALSRELAASGIPTTLVATAEDSGARRGVPDDVEVVVLGSVVDRTSFAVPRLARWLARRPVDVLFSHGNGPNRAAVVARILSRGGTGVVTVEHNHYSTYIAPSGGGYSLPRIRDRMTGFLYARADVVAGVTPEIVADLRQRFRGGHWETAVLPDPGRTPDQIARLTKEPVDHPWYGSPDRPRIVCSVANVIPRKGQHVLVEAFPRLRDLAGDVRLVLVGRHDSPAYLARIVRTAERLGVRDHVALPGVRSNPLPWIAGADAFALASFNEGCPRVLSEAMACGVPVVAADCPSGPAFILEDGRAGLLVPPGDPSATADALARVLLDAALRERLIGRGRERALDFTPANIARRYAEVAGRARPGRRAARSGRIPA